MLLSLFRLTCQNFRSKLQKLGVILRYCRRQGLLTGPARIVFCRGFGRPTSPERELTPTAVKHLPVACTSNRITRFPFCELFFRDRIIHLATFLARVVRDSDHDRVSSFAGVLGNPRPPNTSFLPPPSNACQWPAPAIASPSLLVQNQLKAPS